MLDLSNVTRVKERTHLFIAMQHVSEVDWLLTKAGLTTKDYQIRTWKNILNHKVPALKNLTDKERNEEIVARYGADLRIAAAPAVILSYFNPDELFEALHETLLGAGDADYELYIKTKQEPTDEEGTGIHVLREE